MKLKKSLTRSAQLFPQPAGLAHLLIATQLQCLLGFFGSTAQASPKLSVPEPRLLELAEHASHSAPASPEAAAPHPASGGFSAGFSSGVSPALVVDPVFAAALLPENLKRSSRVGSGMEGGGVPQSQQQAMSTGLPNGALQGAVAESGEEQDLFEQFMEQLTDLGALTLRVQPFTRSRVEVQQKLAQVLQRLRASPEGTAPFALNQKRKDQWAPLTLAAALGLREVVQELLRQKADLGVVFTQVTLQGGLKIYQNYTPVLLAAHNRHPRVVFQLISSELFQTEEHFVREILMAIDHKQSYLLANLQSAFRDLRLLQGSSGSSGLVSLASSCDSQAPQAELSGVSVLAAFEAEGRGRVSAGSVESTPRPVFFDLRPQAQTRVLAGAGDDLISAVMAESVCFFCHCAPGRFMTLLTNRFSLGELVSGECGHSFCKRCFDLWLFKKKISSDSDSSSSSDSASGALMAGSLGNSLDNASSLLQEGSYHAVKCPKSECRQKLGHLFHRLMPDVVSSDQLWDEEARAGRVGESSSAAASLHGAAKRAGDGVRLSETMAYPPYLKLAVDRSRIPVFEVSDPFAGRPAPASRFWISGVLRQASSGKKAADFCQRLGGSLPEFEEVEWLNRGLEWMRIQAFSSQQLTVSKKEIVARADQSFWYRQSEPSALDSLDDEDFFKSASLEENEPFKGVLLSDAQGRLRPALEQAVDVRCVFHRRAEVPRVDRDSQIIQEKQLLNSFWR